MDVGDLDMQDMSLVMKPPQSRAIGSSFDHKMTWMLHACLASRIYVNRLSLFISTRKHRISARDG